MANGIETYGLAGLRGLVEGVGQPAWRAGQIFSWLYGRSAHSFDEMTDLPAALRAQLSEAAPLFFPAVVDKRISADGTRKYILEFADGALVETLGIPSGRAPGGAPERLNVCFSTQVGCAMGCTFCATGREGFTRNLAPGEMAWQVLVVADDFGCRATNAVAMGQGEPFANYENVVDALRILNHAKGPGIGARHITVSTCGLPDGIRRFGEEGEQFTLAVSLHSAVQDVRDRLMPRCAAFPLRELRAALVDYQAKSGRRITIEHFLADGVNSGTTDRDALLAFCDGIHAHVNLLPINNVEGSPLRPCSRTVVEQWKDALCAHGIEASLRIPRGADINGACGQLKNARG